jgi:hypothetical protein
LIVRHPLQHRCDKLKDGGLLKPPDARDPPPKNQPPPPLEGFVTVLYDTRIARGAIHGACWSAFSPLLARWLGGFLAELAPTGRGNDAQLCSPFNHFSRHKREKPDNLSFGVLPYQPKLRFYRSSRLSEFWTPLAHSESSSAAPIDAELGPLRDPDACFLSPNSHRPRLVESHLPPTFFATLFTRIKGVAFLPPPFSSLLIAFCVTQDP